MEEKAAGYEMEIGSDKQNARQQDQTKVTSNIKMNEQVLC